jgi:hypothetical protein
MGAGIPQLHYLVISLSQDLPLAYQDGSERPPARIVAVTPRQFHGHPQVPSGLIIELSGHH